MAIQCWLDSMLLIGFGIIFHPNFVNSVTNNTNSMMGPPDVTCTEDGVAISMETQQPFRGQLYVKDEYENPRCRISFKGVNKPGASFHLTFNECGMRRQRMVNPRGVMYSITVMVQFHDVFVTENDQAFQIRCFYGDEHANVTNSLDVSPVTAHIMEATFPSPTCNYSLRSKSLDGPLASVVKVGDPIMHVFSCDFQIDTYKMLVKDCYVDDGKSQRQLIIGQDGCSVDEGIMQTPQYRLDKLEASGESTAFKWPDGSVVYFSCQIVLCMNEGTKCEEVTPPKCGSKVRSRRSNVHWPHELEFDLEVKKLTVVENDGIRAKPNPIEMILTNGTGYDRNSIIFRQNVANGNATWSGQLSNLLPSPSILRLEENGNSHQQVCFSLQAITIICVFFTLLMASLAVISCRIILPYFWETSMQSDSPDTFDMRNLTTSVQPNSNGKSSMKMDNNVYESSVAGHHRPTTQCQNPIAFSKLNSF